MIRKVFIKPIRRIMNSMNELAHGDFSVRIDTKQDKYVPIEIRQFSESFNKAAEELSGTEILRKDFVNNFSHEFKTPIVSINGFADLLLSADLPKEDEKEFLTIIRDESRRLTNLADTILLLNRIESQTILRDAVPFRIDEQIRQTVLVTQQKWKEKDLDFHLDLSEAEYCGNESLLKEVWVNILDNAAKFSPEGKPIQVTLQDQEDSITVSVTDQGPGIDENTKAHIFEQFYQGDTSHKTQGNGLGMAMVHKIVSLHEGRILIDSSPGNGSCFSVVLPKNGQGNS
ncbi:MAG: HAMP domain-containing histidine kinase [Solobacterium sp.]|nr:HAMP domain-containing histidine kinase [Solobacterium sp.]